MVLSAQFPIAYEANSYASLHAALSELGKTALAKEVEAQVLRCIEHAETVLSVDVRRPVISLKLRGKAAGQLRYRKGRVIQDPELRFNAALLERNRVAFLDEVVPHEVAHFIAYTCYGVRIKPHGAEWRYVMAEVFGVAPRVTHCFDVETKPRKQFSYRCACPQRVHQLSIVRHNRIIRGQNRYRCLDCRTELLKCNGRE